MNSRSLQNSFQPSLLSWLDLHPVNSAWLFGVKLLSSLSFKPETPVPVEILVDRIQTSTSSTNDRFGTVDVRPRPSVASVETHPSRRHKRIRATRYLWEIALSASVAPVPKAALADFKHAVHIEPMTKEEFEFINSLRKSGRESAEQTEAQ